jgi:hypothetical protein
MADINFGILDTQMPGRIAAIPQQQQAQQAQNAMQLMQVQQTMQQNALAKAKMEEYARGTAEKNALRGRMTQPGFDIYDPKQQAEIMGLSPEFASPIIQHALQVRQTEAATNKTNFELTSKKIDRARTAITAAANSEAALAAINKSQAAGDIDAADAAILTKELGNDATFAEGQKRVLQSMLSAKDRLAQQAIKTVDTDRGGYIERQTYDAQGKAVGAPIMLPKTPTPGSIPGIAQANIAAEKARDEGIGVGGVPAAPVAAPANAMAAPAAVGGNAMIPTAPPSVNAMRPGAAPTAAPAVVGRGPSPREIREARAKGFTFNPNGSMSRIPGGPADKAAVERTPVQETKFIKDLANDYTTVTATMQGMQDVIDSISDVRRSDISGATGFSAYIPTIPGGKTAQAETNLANLKGKITSLGQTIANQSGKIGPMAVQEWTIVRDMVSALDTAVKKGESITRDEIDKIEFTAKNIAERIKNKFEGQYGEELSSYPQFATIPEPKSRTSGKITQPQKPPAAGAGVTVRDW